ncbi:unnamed protein product, partial [Ceratitis capitata]
NVLESTKAASTTLDAHKPKLASTTTYSLISSANFIVEGDNVVQKSVKHAG